MGYQNYFNVIQNAASYANTVNYSNYANNNAQAYGTSCSQSYTNYANAMHAAPGGFNANINQSLFDSGSHVLNSVGEIKKMRNALYRISNEKADSNGKQQDIVITGAADAGALPTPSNWPNSAISDAELEPDKKMRAAQVQALANVTKDLWDSVMANNPNYTKQAFAKGDPATGASMKDLAQHIQDMANCTQSNYKNTRTAHDDFYFTAGTDCSHSSTSGYANATYYPGPNIPSIVSTSGQNVSAADARQQPVE